MKLYRLISNALFDTEDVEEAYRINYDQETVFGRISHGIDLLIYFSFGGC